MKKFVAIVLLAAAALPVVGSISSGSSENVVVVAVPQAKTVAVSLTMPADFVSVPLNVISDQKNAALAYEESRQAIELIVQKAKEDGRFRISRGVAALSQHRSSFGISSGSWTQPAAAAQMALLVPLTKERDNIFAAGAEAARFIEALHFPGKSRCEIGNLQLAVDNPEQYRSRVLALIADEVKKTREALGTAGSVRVDGLQTSVLVRQADDRNVELFLGYSLSITTGGERQN